MVVLLVDLEISLSLLLKVKWPKHSPHLVEESVCLLRGNSISSWRLHKSTGIKEWYIEILLNLIDALVDSSILSINKPSFDDIADFWINCFIKGDESTVAMHLVVGKLTLVKRCFVHGSAHSLLSSVGLLVEVVFVDDCDWHFGIDGEHLLDPVRLEVEGASDERQKAGELSGGLRCVKALKLCDEAGVDDVGEHLVGDLLSG